jgi:PEP-CTERM motif
MRQTRQMLTRVGLFAAATSAALLFAGQGLAQTVVQYTGSLMIGFGDSDNTGDLANNSVPICAVNGSPFAPATFGSLPVYGRATQTAGGALTFHAHGRGDGGGPQVESLKGGAEVRVAATCNVQVPPFLNPRLRSRIQAAQEIFPGIKGDFQGNLVPNTPMGVFVTPTPMVAPTWMVGPGQGNSFAGPVLNTPIPFFAGAGAVRITKGANNYGGAIQYQGGGGVQLGINTTLMTGGGATVMNFGLVRYVNGFLPTDPTLFGTDATGKFGPGATTMFPNGAIVGNQRTMALRTPGGVTINQQGKIVTALGGNTVTPMAPGGPALRSPVNFQGAFFQWTTGQVRHTDMVGDFVTMRTAMGFDDTSLTPGTAPFGTTRKLQLVSPWSASIKRVGPFGLPVPQLGFGGLAVLNLDITPAPEPGAVAMLGIGALGLAGLVGLRRRGN